MILCAPIKYNLNNYDNLIKFNYSLIQKSLTEDLITKINIRINNIIEIINQIRAHILDGDTNFNVYNMKIKKEQIIIKSLLFLFSYDLNVLNVYNVVRPDIKIDIDLLNKICDIDIIDVIYTFYKYNSNIKIYMLDKYNIRIDYSKRESLILESDIILNINKSQSIHNNICNLINNNKIISSSSNECNNDFILSIFYLVLLGINFM